MTEFPPQRTHGWIVCFIIGTPSGTRWIKVFLTKWFRFHSFIFIDDVTIPRSEHALFPWSPWPTRVVSRLVHYSVNKIYGSNVHIQESHTQYQAVPNVSVSLVPSLTTWRHSFYTGLVFLAISNKIVWWAPCRCLYWKRGAMDRKINLKSRVW